MTEQEQQNETGLLVRRVEEWVAQVRRQGGQIGEEDLEELLTAVRTGRLRQRLLYLQENFGGRIATRTSSPQAVAEELAGADLAILSVLVPGAAAPLVVTREMVRSMGPGAVIVDVSIDQGGASETSRPTSHSDPTYIEEGVIHYCVTNMPGAVPQTSTQALTSATLPYVEALADRGIEGALRADQALGQSLSTWQGALVRGPVADEFGIGSAPNPFLQG